MLKKKKERKYKTQTNLIDQRQAGKKVRGLS
jgi:hypothetical protein